jgi:hypothetical protein
MPTLHAVLVAINDYPNPAHRLTGCVNDLTAMHAFLGAHCARFGLTYRHRILKNDQAKRADVIEAFAHFAPAAEGDQCLLFFAGHGARAKAPEAFHALESDKTLESLVCFDSREPGGRDLLDKELSYLIQQAMHDKPMPLITVFDCCHSGRMRNLIEDAEKPEVLAVRQVRELGDAPPVAEFLGYDDYKRHADGQLGVLLGRRVHLAAARDVETAREVSYQGQPRGIFTCCLLQALEAAPLGSYLELVNRAQLRVRANIAGQSPQLDARDAADKRLRFLSLETESAEVPYFISYDASEQAWFVNGGAVHGFEPGDEQERMVLELADDKTQVAVTEVQPHRSRVEDPGDRDRVRLYAATVVRRPAPSLVIVPAPDADAEAVEALKKGLAASKSDLVQLGESTETADFVVRARSNQLALTRTAEERPLFQRMHGYDERAIKSFVEQLLDVARWRQAQNLANPHTEIGEHEIAIELYRTLKAEDYDDTAAVEAVNWRQVPQFHYLPAANGRRHQPAFQLRLRNDGPRKLWVSLLYLGFDFSVTNALLPRVQLNPGEEVWAREADDGYEYRTIALQIEDGFQQQGLRTIREMFKVLVCTEELNTDSYNQEGLKIDKSGAPVRGVLTGWRRQKPEKRDWTAIDVPIEVTLDDPEAQSS